jgi:anthranilate phosphoribosyltransferase
MRAIRTEELEGFRDAMLELCLPVNLDGREAIDLCGTGGDGKDTFNISTTACFVTAGAGVLVAKHGNYGVSSISGSSNVLAALGCRFSADPGLMLSSLDQAGICFMHAPFYHPAMKHVAPIRKELGLRTFFNMLGPMVNPARPAFQLVGVYSLELARLYGYIYQNAGKRFSIVHALDGYDEVSLTGPCKLITPDGEGLLTAQHLGLDSFTQKELHGGDTIEASAKILTEVLAGCGTPAQEQVVLANACLAIATARNCPYDEALAAARASIASGAATHALQTFLELNS